MGEEVTRQRRFGASFSDAFIFSVTGAATAPGEARHEFSDRLDGRLQPDTMETARLLVSELVTNCVRHGDAGRGGAIEVSGALLERTLRIEVAGRGPEFEHTPTRPDPSTVGGRGLFLVEALSTSWGIAASEDRTTVWCEIPRD
jgi:anti-sigma regulatory factor (Ser/Thr protein kinase)